MNYQTNIILTSALQIDLELLRAIIPDKIPENFALSANNPDIFQIKREKSSIGIAEIKELVAWNAQKPFYNSIKLGVIFNSESMTPEAQNSLLKTLEEPAPDTQIYLITRNLAVLLPTIISRSSIIYDQTAQAPIEDNPDREKVVEFLKQDIKGRVMIIDKLIKEKEEDGREKVVRFIETLMRQLIDSRENRPQDVLIRDLEACKLSYIGLKSGTGTKLTLETLAISIS